MSPKKNTNEITKKAYAKINLTLEVLGKRSDGYHDIVSVMQAVSLHDIVTIKKTTGGIDVFWNLPEKPNERNTAYRAADLMLKRYNISGGAEIRIEKRIPVSAGLGGGSADAAAVIEGMNELFGLTLEKDELIRTGAEIGADVPFCLLKNAALAEGIGEKLTELPSKTRAHVVLAKPNISISSKSAYQKLDEFNEKNIKRLSGKGICYSNIVASALAKSDIKALCRGLYNSFEPVAEAEYPIITKLKLNMLSHGARGSLMSGSGPTVYGLFENAFQAENTCAAIMKEYGIEAFCCAFYYNNVNGGDIGC